jgi:hypothetical protein
VDLTDEDGVRAVLDRVRDESGRIDVLVHAAGLEISHLLPDKEPEEYELVFDVKADGWFNLLKAAEDLPVSAAVVFSSIAARFGNGGQTDYAAANDLLCKCISNLRSTRPDTRGIAIDWTAWGEIGMASRGSIPKMMKQSGIDMLPPTAGIPVLGRELTWGGAEREVVIGLHLGALLEEWDDQGGLDVDAVQPVNPGPMLGRVVRMGVYEGLVVETELDPARQAFLYDHKIDDTAVLPGVMGVEGFAELAELALPGWQIQSIEDVRFLAPFKFYRGKPREVRLVADFVPEGDSVVALCSLIGVRHLAKQPEPQVTTHFTGRVRMGRAATEPARSAAPHRGEGPVVRSDDVYRVYFHGPAYRVVHSVWRDSGDEVIGMMAADLPANHTPAGRPLSIAPRHIELCFQTAGVLEMGSDGTMGLPLQIGRIEKLRDASEGASFSVVTRRGQGESAGFDAQVLDESGNVYLRMEDYRTVELPGAVDADRIAPIRSVIERRDA